MDDDDDGAVDCDDADCTDAPECTAEICDNGDDDDGDGDVDCDDADCEGDPACAPETESECDDGVDEDLDSLTDCEDPDCSEQCDEDCTNELDDDADGFVDCLDSECAGTEVCLEDCSDGVDNDADGYMDCEDADCAAQFPCYEDCSDGVDNDDDGLADCDDEDCAATLECPNQYAVVTGGHAVFSGVSSGGFRYSYAHGRSTWSSYRQSSMDLWADSVQGKVVSTWDTGSTTACTWSLTYAHLSQFSSSYYHSGGWGSSVASYMGVVSRSGFAAPGCASSFGSDDLPTRFQVSSSIAWERTGSGTTSGAWYQGSMSNTHSGYFSSSHPGEFGGRFMYGATYGFNLHMNSGDPWAIE